MSLCSEQNILVTLEVHFLWRVIPDTASQVLESTENHLPPNKIYKMGLHPVLSMSEQTEGILNGKSLHKEASVRVLHH